MARQAPDWSTCQALEKGGERLHTGKKADQGRQDDGEEQRDKISQPRHPGIHQSTPDTPKKAPVPDEQKMSPVLKSSYAWREERKHNEANTR